MSGGHFPWLKIQAQRKGPPGAASVCMHVRLCVPGPMRLHMDTAAALAPFKPSHAERVTVVCVISGKDTSALLPTSAHLDLVHPDDTVLLITPADGGAQGIGVLQELVSGGVRAVMDLRAMAAPGGVTPRCDQGLSFHAHMTGACDGILM